MGKKKIVKIIMLILIIVTVVSFYNYKVYAYAAYAGSITILEDAPASSPPSTDPTENPDYWKPTITEESELTEKAGIILGAINVIGVVISVVVMMVIGLKYMIGSVEEKAEYKKTMGVYIIGMVFLVACTTIPNIIYTIAEKLFE